MFEPEDDQESRIHAVFEVLRRHVVTVSRDFARRVTERIEQAEEDDRTQPPNFGGVVGEMFVQAANLLSGLLGASGEPPPPEDDEDEHDD